ncbi:putative bifunctional diguanylate cyclase/phosphodiesterase [Gimesia alba]|nr:EAL domain-containing protein [Gimesia alba]
MNKIPEADEIKNQDRITQDVIPFSWPVIPLIGIIVVIVFGVFVLIYELKQVALTRHVIHVDVARQSLSGKVAIDVLQCRRYEKDVFLNLQNPEKLSAYLKKWQTAWNKLSIDTDFLSRQIANEEELRLQVLLNESVKQYRTHFMSVVAQIDSGEIDSPEQANQAMSPFKDGMRELIMASSRLAVDTATHATKSGSELVWCGGISVAVVFFMTVAPGLILVILFRKYNLRLMTANDQLQTYNAELKQSEELERLARDQAIQAKDEIEDALKKIESQRRELEQSEQQFRTLVNNIPGVTFRSHVDENRTLEFISVTVEELVGYPATDLVHNEVRSFASIIHPEDVAKVNAAIRVAAKEPKSFQVGYRVVRADGQIRFVWEQGQVAADSKYGVMVDGVVFDVTERKKAEIELRKSKEVFERASLLDKLTGLPNRALFHDRLNQVLQKSRRESNSNYAVIFLDFDRFKMVNDSMGHDVGDMLLVEIGTRLRNQLRCTDSISRQVAGHTAGRLGGDEFIILLDGIRNTDEVVTVAERLLIDFARPYNLKNHEVYSTASMGIVIGNKHYKRAEDVIRDADTAMYEAKRMGKSRYVIFDDSMRKRVMREMMLENDLRKAIEHKQLKLFYQPIVSLESGAVCSVEALIRWNHPRHGIISPGEFIPIAEDTQQIIELGEWVLREGCRQYADWAERLEYQTPSMISINLSRKQFACPLLVHTVQRTLEEFQVAPKHIQLEVTEDAFASDIKSAIQAMKDLKAIGVKLAIDDFGIGRSSFASLNQFPVDTLKIDRSLIAEVKRTKGMAAMINSLVVLSENLGIMLIPEGIEEASQVTALQKLGCHFGQGYYFGRPMPAEKLEAYLLKQPNACFNSVPQMA